MSPAAKYAFDFAPALWLQGAAAEARAPALLAGALGEEVSTIFQGRPKLRAGAAVSAALHVLMLAAALLWTESAIFRAPEPIAVEVIVESPADAPKAAEAFEPPPAVDAPDPSAPATPPSPEALQPEPPAPPAEVATAPDPTPAEPAPASSPKPDALIAPAFAAPVITMPPQAAPTRPHLPTLTKTTAETPLKPARTPAQKTSQKPEATHVAAGASPPASNADIGSYRDGLFARIAARTHYPEAALDRGARGTAEVKFSIDDAGQVIAVALAQSSGDPVLDADAPATVRRAGPFGAPPRGAPHDYFVPIHYRPH